MYHIWITIYKDGKFVGRSMYWNMYARKGYAERIARMRYDKPTKNGLTFEWIVAEENPFMKGE